MCAGWKSFLLNHSAVGLPGQVWSPLLAEVFSSPQFWTLLCASSVHSDMQPCTQHWPSWEGRALCASSSQGQGSVLFLWMSLPLTSIPENLAPCLALPFPCTCVMNTCVMNQINEWVNEWMMNGAWFNHFYFHACLSPLEPCFLYLGTQFWALTSLRQNISFSLLRKMLIPEVDGLGREEGLL